MYHDGHIFFVAQSDTTIRHHGTRSLITKATISIKCAQSRSIVKYFKVPNCAVFEIRFCRSTGDRFLRFRGCMKSCTCAWGVYENIQRAQFCKRDQLSKIVAKSDAPTAGLPSPHKAPRSCPRRRRHRRPRDFAPDADCSGAGGFEIGERGLVQF